MDQQDQQDQQGQDDGGQVSEVSGMGAEGAERTIFPEDATAGYPTGGEGSPQSEGDEEHDTAEVAGEGTRPDEGTAGPDAAPHQG